MWVWLKEQVLAFRSFRVRDKSNKTAKEL